jgi:hypothetical protein
VAERIGENSDASDEIAHRLPARRVAEKQHVGFGGAHVARGVAQASEQQRRLERAVTKRASVLVELLERPERDPERRQEDKPDSEQSEGNSSAQSHRGKGGGRIRTQFMQGGRRAFAPPATSRRGDARRVERRRDST